MTSSSGVDLVTEPCYGGCSRGRAAVTGATRVGRPLLPVLSQTPHTLFFSCAPFLRRGSIPSATSHRTAHPSFVALEKCSEHIVRCLGSGCHTSAATYLLTWLLGGGARRRGASPRPAVASAGSSLREAICDRFRRWNSALSAPFAAWGGGSHSSAATPSSLSIAPKRKGAGAARGGGTSPV